MRYLAAVPATGLLAGTALGLFGPELPPLISIFSMCAGALVAYAAWRSTRPVVLAAAAACAFCAGGHLLAARAWQRAWNPPLLALVGDGGPGGTPVEVAGVLRADAAPGANGVSLSIDVDRAGGLGASESAMTPNSGGALVTVAGVLAGERLSEWRAGRRVRLPVQLRRPSRYLDPGVPDQERALARRGTRVVGVVKSGALVEVLSKGSWWDEAVSGARAFARHALATHVARWNAQSGAIVAAIVIGDRAGLDPDVQRRLQEAGTYHVIAISGGNIAILAGLMIGAFRVTGLLGRTAMSAAIAVLLAYADLVGGGASVNRATLMAVLYLGGRLLDHRSPPLNTLAAAVALLVAVEPLSIGDPAFVLTCGATLGILVVMPMLAGRSDPRWIVPILSMAAASAAAELALFPVAALVFSRVTFAGLALNFLAIPLMAVAQVAGMAVVPLALVSARAASLSGFVAHVGAAGLVHSANLVRYAPALAYRVAPPSTPVVFVYYTAMAIAVMGWRRMADRARRTVVLVAAASAVWILAEPWAWAAARGDGRLHVTFIDVGQGDSAFLEGPQSDTMLVDAGGLGPGSSFDVGDRVVAPVLRNAGVRRLGHLVLTHGDPDHIGGASAIVDEFRPREVWEGIPVPAFAPLNALRLRTERLGLRWSRVHAGDAVVVDGIDVRVMHPPVEEWERQKVRNDDSVVLDLRWRSVSILLTGDIGKDVERTLGRRILPAPLRVLKVPHHGSHTSSTEDFVRAVHPDVAVVSVGRGNHFGHPVPEVLRRYEDDGAAIFRTDQDGAVMIDTDGSSIDVRTFTGRHFQAVQRQ